MLTTKLITASIVASLITPAFATVSLIFNGPSSTQGGVTSNFADRAGTPTNGLIWGIIVDTDNNGFSPTYDLLALSTGQTSPLSINGASSGDVLVTSQFATLDTSGDTEFNSDFTQEINPGGPGGLGSITSVVIGGPNMITPADTFRLVWFDPDQRSAGFIDDATFVIGADGSNLDYSNIFRGPDPIRPATGITLIPEPSTALLSVLGLGLLVRRRRS